jgi:mannose-6-phosphate isomerase
MRPYFREMVWGGRRLAELYGKDLPPGQAIGESFELSAYPGRESVVASGPLAGRDLRNLVEEYGEELVGRQVKERYGGRFPLLIKLLDAQQDLSVQVHPDDAYTRRKKLADDGKMEAWFVLHAEDGRVAYGLQPGVDPPAFAAALEAGRVEEVIRFYPVQAGDVVFVPPGIVHALCRGVVLYEVQQSSDLTFRIYDYGRLGLDGRPRLLHLEVAMEVIDFGADPGQPVSWRHRCGAESDRAVLVECEHFRLNLYQRSQGVIRHGAGDSFLGLTLVAGEAVVSGSRRHGRDGDGVALRSGDTALIPARREFKLVPRSETGCTYLIASVDSVARAG